MALPDASTRDLGDTGNTGEEPPIPYCLPLRRPLSPHELALVQTMLRRDRPQLLEQLPRLHVVARCGCGACPTVLFSDRIDGAPDTAHPWGDELMTWGEDGLGNVVEALLIIRQGKISELEVSVLAGPGEDYGLPLLDSLESEEGRRSGAPGRQHPPRAGFLR